MCWHSEQGQEAEGQEAVFVVAVMSLSIATPHAMSIAIG